MTIESQLINKTYYETFTDGVQNVHPIRVLGGLHFDEQQQEIPDLSYIRFAQGEIYYLHKDYESAIFKWENVANELEPWAQKNLGDAHYCLGLFAIAEDYYKTIETNSDVLKIEVLLQLFSIYIELEKTDLAMESIKKAVDLNPDYPDVTDIARAFFEDHHKWGDAVELALHEAIRTESISWFEILETYVEQGHTKTMDPKYFNQTLIALYRNNIAQFESLTAALWRSYKHTDIYFSWLKEINQILINTEQSHSHMWKHLSILYKETYFELIDGSQLIKDLTSLLTEHLSNWAKISTPSNQLMASAAILAWSDLFPTTLEDPVVVRKAEGVIRDSARNKVSLEKVFQLFNSIIYWAKERGVSLDARCESLVEELKDVNQFNLIIRGSTLSSQKRVVNKLLNQNILEESTVASIFVKDADETEVQAVTDDGVKTLTTVEEYKESSKDKETFIRYHLPNTLLQQNKLAIYSPGFVDFTNSQKNEFPHIQFADSMLFVLNVDSPLTPKELDMAVRMKEEAPELAIHFLLISENDQFVNKDLMEKTKSRILTYFPKANIYHDTLNHDRRAEELSSFIRSITDTYYLREERTQTLLSIIKQTVTLLLEKRIEMESSLIEEMEWNKEIGAKLNDTIKQLNDGKEKMIQDMIQSYVSLKTDIRKKMMQNIPEQLKSCAEIINEDCDFERLPHDLNQEMSKRITAFLKEEILPGFQEEVQEWIKYNEQEFKDIQVYLDEMSEEINRQYGEQKINLAGDFKILDDWKRDSYRMTRGSTQLEMTNILKLSAPSQLFLKSAGKLFDTFRQTKERVHYKYKRFIENKDYSETAELLTGQFIQQFELFENSLEWDINLFYEKPLEILNQVLTETEAKIAKRQEELSQMRKNPEIYRDPLTLFELQLRQYEWMIAAGKQHFEFHKQY
ncbi:tetratricopeptide repeat protein [Salinibacillus xinjiangensis]|uniref:GTP-binding protein n=1 Tax=Salinibacillus xinjiangensis TaxID=1229268 RepID=A0A6G1X903_9BACI|nr:GTP-binding protein [Salinibacillus xinjiangensis]MRG87422.1 GTP-binding protein [Salinibacillus xinjiangensis]